MTSTITSLARATRTASQSGSTAIAVCTWEGHCLGDSCSGENDCDRDWVCGANKTCQTCCVSDSQPTFFSTFSSSKAATTTPLSPISSSPATPSPSSSATNAPTQASSGGLSTGAAVGIGLGGGALLILCIVGGWWSFMRRRKSNAAHELGAVSTSSYDDDRKELYRATGQVQELPISHPPTELQAVELHELQGSEPGKSLDKPKAGT